MKYFIFLLFIVFSQFGSSQIPSSSRSEKAIQTNSPKLEQEFKNKGLVLGAAVFIRIFKETNDLEVWIKDSNLFKHFKTYKICYFSGGLGTKTKQGDGKSPEGFYFVTKDMLNPYSNYHLSFGVGYPNKYERQRGYTGSAIMIHGNCVSIGCYAMTDPFIEEIYTLLYKAFVNGQNIVRLHIFPFRMNDAKLNQYKDSEWYELWKNMQQGYLFFEQKKIPPDVRVENRNYTFY